MEMKGLLIGVSRYSFPDKQTGELIEGGKVIVGIPAEGRRKSDVVGLIPQDVKIAYEDFSRIGKEAAQNIGRMVTLECDVTLRGRYTNLRCISIKAEAPKSVEAA